MLLKKLRGHVRIKRGQKIETNAGIMDSQSVKLGNNVALSGVNGNKKVKGIKRHVIVDKNGFLIAVMVTGNCIFIKREIKGTQFFHIGFERH